MNLNEYVARLAVADENHQTGTQHREVMVDDYKKHIDEGYVAKVNQALKNAGYRVRGDSPVDIIHRLQRLGRSDI